MLILNQVPVILTDDRATFSAILSKQCAKFTIRQFRNIYTVGIHSFKRILHASKQIQTQNQMVHTTSIPKLNYTVTHKKRGSTLHIWKREWMPKESYLFIYVTCDEWPTRLHACVRTNGGHFKHTLWLSICFLCTWWNLFHTTLDAVGSILRLHYLWLPYVIGQAIYIFILWFLLLLFSSPNLSGRRLDVYHTSTHGVALV